MFTTTDWKLQLIIPQYGFEIQFALIQAGRFVFPDTLITEDKFEWCQVPVSKVLPSNIMKICEKPIINNEIFIKTRLKRQMKGQQTNSIDCTYPGSV